jgi:hypothetical protein
MVEEEIPSTRVNVHSAPFYRPATASGRRLVTSPLQLRRRIPGASLGQTRTDDTPNAATRRGEGVERGHGIHRTERARYPPDDAILPGLERRGQGAAKRGCSLA